MKKPKTEKHSDFTFIDRRGVNKKEVKEKLWEENVRDKYTEQELVDQTSSLIKMSPCNFPFSLCKQFFRYTHPTW